MLSQATEDSPAPPNDTTTARTSWFLKGSRPSDSRPTKCSGAGSAAINARRKSVLSWPSLELYTLPSRVRDYSFLTLIVASHNSLTMNQAATCME